MKLLLNDNVFGWRMTGIIGKDAKWFLGFSRNPRNLSPERKIESETEPESLEGSYTGVGDHTLNFRRRI